MMHQIAYDFCLSIKKCAKLGQNSLAHFVSFFIYALLDLMGYSPRFRQMKDLIKIYICGKFNHYSICGCEVRDFWIDSASIKWPLFRVFWALTFSDIVQSC